MNKTLTAISIAALLSAGSFSAMAEDTTVKAGTDAGVSVDAGKSGVDVNAGTDVNAGAKAGDSSANMKAGANANADAMGNAGGMSDNTYGSVISSIKAGGAADLSAVTDESTITIVLLSSLQGDATTESQALDNALSADAESLTTVQTNVSGNAAIAAKLEAEGYTASDVVAIKTAADGAVTLYVDDRDQ